MSLELFHQRRAHEHQVNNSSGFTPYSCLFSSGLIRHSQSQRCTHLCSCSQKEGESLFIATGSVTEVHYPGHTSLTCTHCEAKWTSFRYCLGEKTDLFCASHLQWAHITDRSATKIFPVKWNMEEYGLMAAVVGVAMWQWFKPIVVFFWKLFKHFYSPCQICLIHSVLSLYFTASQHAGRAAHAHQPDTQTSYCLWWGYKLHLPASLFQTL